MTKLSDYISERRNDPEKNGNLFVFCMIGVAIIIIAILCLLLLWRKNADQKEKEPAFETDTFTETTEPVMSPSDENGELKQQYLYNIETLGEKVRELMQSMTEVKETLEGAVTTQREDNTELIKQVKEITGDITSLITRLDNTRNQLYDLTDIINVMDTDTIPVIQAQITMVEEQMAQVHTDISDIYKKIDALEATDGELQARIDKIEGNLKDSVEQNITNITNQFADMSTHIRQIEEQIGDSRTQIGDLWSKAENLQEQIGNLQTQFQEQIENLYAQLDELSAKFLRYRYEEETNTLYLMTD